MKPQPLGWFLQANRVAPHAGAWIETACTVNDPSLGASPPMRGRGLKHL